MTAPFEALPSSSPSGEGEWSWVDSLSAVWKQHDELSAEAQLLRLQLGAVETQLDRHAAAIEKARELRDLLRQLRPVPTRPEPKEAPPEDEAGVLPEDEAGAPPEDATAGPEDDAAPPDCGSAAPETEAAVPPLDVDVVAPGTAAASPAARRPRRRLAARAGRMAAAGVVGLLAVTMLLVSVGPRFLPYQSLVVRSGSMSPNIPTGSLVLYHRAAATQIKVGDVIVFAKPGSADEKVTHRVYRIVEGPNGRYFETKGDANGAPDAWRIAATGTGWVAFAHVPDVGYVLGYLQTGAARMLLIVIPALLLGALTLVEIWRPRGGTRHIVPA